MALKINVMPLPKIRYSLTVSAPGRKKGELCVVAGLQGQSIGRRTFAPPSIVNYNPSDWDRKNCRFKENTESARSNNAAVEDLVKLCEGLSVDSHINTADEFIDALKKIVKPPVPPMTFGDFIESLITEMKTGANNKGPSRTFQLYVNLLHNLQKEGCIINLLVRDVNNSHFIQFSDFILSLTDKEGRSNYMNLMKLFKQVHKKAYNRELTDNILRYKYSDYAPMRDDTDKNPALTVKQYEKFINMDPNKVGVFGPNVAFYNVREEY